jgi:hypothetical protein
MNSLARAAVSIAMVVSASCVAGCVAIDGGAIELAWTVRTLDARPADCQTQRIDTVSLCIQDCDTSDAGVCSGETRCPFVSFSCTRLRGTTDFNVSPGRKRLWITATCQNGAAADVEVPEAVVRDVTRGDVTELNALLISVPSVGMACGS